MTDSYIALSIQMISKTSCIINIKTKPCHYSAQLILSKIRYISQTTVHHTDIKRLIITYYIKRSLHTTLILLNHHTLMSFSITLCSYEMITFSIHINHMKWLSVTVIVFTITLLIIIVSILICLTVRMPVITLIM